MDTKSLIKKKLRKYLIENLSTNMTLYHGSSDLKIFDRFYDNQFFTVNDYIASSYAYNLGGLMYEVEVPSLNSFNLKNYDKERNPDEYHNMVNLIKELYGDESAKKYERNYFHPSPATTFYPSDFEPMINWAKDNGYDSLMFIDESFDRHIRDTSYNIFDGNKVKIKSIFDVNDAFESDFQKPFKKIK
jgi:hypothetical protein